MEYNLLGRTGERVSRVSLGTWSYGGANIADSTPVGWAGQTEADSIAALKLAFDLGINHWDTADVYGNGRSEKIIGSIWGAIPRDKIFLATKVGWDRGSYDHWYHPEHMRRQMDRSLKNLRTEWVDLLYLHHCNFGKQGEYFDDALEVVRRFQEEGKTRFTG
ncbi:MAG: aldo/keto reductase, partial [Fidelibacterota bacterium]